MITKPTTIEKLKAIFTEILINKTPKVTKVAPLSVLSGIAYGVAKIGQKAMKSIALIESHIFPDSAYGVYLDKIATWNGIPLRFGALGSYTHVLINADVGTTYLAGVHLFKANGIGFELVNDVTVGSEGYVYAEVLSVQSGSASNVPALSINTVSPQPSGHVAVFNEYAAQGGRDYESDEMLRRRIKGSSAILEKNTMNHITQVFIKYNHKVLQTYNYGVNAQNQPIIAVATVNGQSLTSNELDTLKSIIAPYLSLRDYNMITPAAINVEVRNIDYVPIDISVRLELNQSTNPDNVRKDLQIAISKYFDIRYWKVGRKVEWDNLLEIVKSDINVKYVADTFFAPHGDLTIPIGKFPRVRGFRLLDMDGNLIIDNSNVLNPIYYPNNVDFYYQTII